MITNIYKPSPLLLPQELVNNNLAIKQLLLSYASTYCYAPNSDALIRFGFDEVLDDEGKLIETFSQLRAPSDHDKLALLQHPIPLYYDVFITHNKLLAIGPYLPHMDELLGKPTIFLRHKTNTAKAQEGQYISYFKDDNSITYRPGKYLNKYLDLSPKKTPKYFRPLSYLVMEQFSPTIHKRLLEQPEEWSVIFKFNDFEQDVKLQTNPFGGRQGKGKYKDSNRAAKSTLITLQKDNPSEWISNWCNYYHNKHDVSRIIIYNNGPLAQDALSQLQVNNDIELWYVEWPHHYQQYFNQCQLGALNHAYRWVDDVASYFLNFDIDEYLVNDSGMSLDNYLSGKYSHGFVTSCYEVSPDIACPNYLKTNDKSIKDLSCQALPISATGKSIYRPSYWDLVNVHDNSREAFIIDPAFKSLLHHSSRDFRFWLARYCYRYPFHRFSSIREILGLKQAPAEDFYFLHYRSLNTYWKL